MATNGWLCGPAHLRPAQAHGTWGQEGPWPQAPCQPCICPSPCTLHAGRLFPAWALYLPRVPHPCPCQAQRPLGCVRRAGSLLGPLLTGHSHKAPHHISHTPHQTPGSSAEGGGAGRVTGPAHPPSVLSLIHPTPGLETLEATGGYPRRRPRRGKTGRERRRCQATALLRSA